MSEQDLYNIGKRIVRDLSLQNFTAIKYLQQLHSTRNSEAVSDSFFIIDWKRHSVSGMNIPIRKPGTTCRPLTSLHPPQPVPGLLHTIHARAHVRKYAGIRWMALRVPATKLTTPMCGTTEMLREQSKVLTRRTNVMTILTIVIRGKRIPGSGI